MKVVKGVCQALLDLIIGGLQVLQVLLRGVLGGQIGHLGLQQQPGVDELVDGEAVEEVGIFEVLGEQLYRIVEVGPVSAADLDQAHAHQ